MDFLWKLVHPVEVLAGVGWREEEGWRGNDRSWQALYDYAQRTKEHLFCFQKYIRLFWTYDLFVFSYSTVEKRQAILVWKGGLA